MHSNYRGVHLRFAGLPVLLAAIALSISASPIVAQTVSSIHDFNTYPEGVYLTGKPVQGSDSAFYGMAGQGGESGNGLVYRYSATDGYSILYTFTGQTDGSGSGLLIAGKDGALYGSNNSGIFRLTLSGAFSIVQSYASHAEAANVSSLIQGQDGLLYGAGSIYGGTGTNATGAIFRMKPNGGAFKTIYNFGPSSGNRDGIGPASLMQGTDGTLYCATLSGGAHQSGTLISMSTSGGARKILHTFVGSGSEFGASLLFGANGNLYGVDSGNFTDPATLYRIQPTGAGFTTLYTFPTGASAGVPYSLTQGSDGALYGVTSDGNLYDLGTVYRCSLDGSSFMTVHTFSGPDGFTPQGLTPGSDGALYGATLAGGASGRGTLFKITTKGTFSTIYNLDGDTDGAWPQDLALGRDGNLYGITTLGGLYNQGCIFRQAPGGAISTLYSFNTGTYTNEIIPGITFFGGIVQSLAAPLPAANGSLYGVNSWGSVNGSGYLYDLTPNGQMTTLYTFSVTDYANRNPDGAGPNTLVQAPDGRLYGTAALGGKHGYGTIFSIEPNGTDFKTHYSFKMSSDQGYPAGPLIVGLDGALYGTTSGFAGVGYSPSGYGSIFKYKPGGKFTTLYTSTDPTQAANPVGALVQGSDGTLYGVCAYTGPNVSSGQLGYGSIFSAKPDGSAFKNLYTFTGQSDGGIANPYNFLLEPQIHYLAYASNGKLCGISPEGSLVYEINTDGSGFTVIDAFVPTAVGSGPQAIATAPDGFLYGVNAYWGDQNSGELFRFAP